MDNETKLITLLSEYPIIRKVGEDLLIDCDWDLERAKKNVEYLLFPETQISDPTTTKKEEPHYISDDDEEIPQFIKEKVDMPQKILNLITRSKERKKWLLILLFQKEQNPDWINDESLKKVLLSRFEYLITSMERSESQFLVTAYDLDVSDSPAYVILDPNDLIHFKKGNIKGNQNEFANFLNDYLFINTKYGLPITINSYNNYNNNTEESNNNSSSIPSRLHSNQSQNSLSSSPSDSDSAIELEDDENSSNETNSSNDKGEIITIALQTLDRKKCQIEIGENEKISALYKKVSQLIGADENTFSLQISIPLKELSNKNSTIKEENLKNAFLRVIHFA